MRWRFPVGCYTCLTLECKHCGHPIIKPEGWFMRATQFNCERCKREVQLTYDEKIALFAKHSHPTSRI